jgi:periplasmic divalent cation tolerance protein
MTPTMVPDGGTARVVLVTAPDVAHAERIARALVERGLAACCNLVGGVRSIYRWQGAIEEAAEVLLVLKTTAARQAELEAAVCALHPYDVPEFVALTASHVAPAYLRWLQAETGHATA